MHTKTDYLGEFLVRNFHNTAVALVEGLCEGKFKSPGHREYQALLSDLTLEQKAVVRKVVEYCVSGALNDTLHKLDTELNGKAPRIQIQVDGVSVGAVESPSSLGSKLWGPSGWLARYSGL